MTLVKKLAKLAKLALVAFASFGGSGKVGIAGIAGPGSCSKRCGVWKNCGKNGQAAERETTPFEGGNADNKPLLAEVEGIPQKGRSSKIFGMALRRRIRSCQWAHWQKYKDSWLQTGVMLQEMGKV